MFKKIQIEIASFIARKLNRGKIVPFELVVSEIVAARSGITGPDADFYRVCTYKVVKETVKTCIGKYKANKKNQDQLSLPGFQHLQIAYPVTRNDVHMLVPIDQLTDGELAARADEYESMARGCRDHAREIRGYIQARTAANDNAPAKREAA